jgi:suppressor for copper-sensitivity B
MMEKSYDFASLFIFVKLPSLWARFALFFAFFWAACLPAAASGLSSNWVGDPSFVEARLISAVTARGDLYHLPLGLEFRLAPKWKIYWRTPGEAGLSPTIDLLADGVPVESRIKWPVPKRFNAFGFDNYGYDNTVILPLDVSGFVAGGPLQLSGQIDALVCADICVPLSGAVEMTIPAGPASPSIYARAIAQAAALVPRQGGNKSLVPDHVWQVADALYMRFAAPFPIDDIFIEGIEGVAFKRPRLDGTHAIIAIEAMSVPDLAGRDITATIVAGNAFIEQRSTIHAVAPELSASKPGWMMFVLALLGGLILNLMPCVLPVLAIKIGSVLDAAGQQKSLIRVRFLSAAAGIVTSFVILAAVLATMRLAGAQIGWGVQFQSPVFLSVMLLLIGLFVLAMLDRLILPVPGFALRWTAAPRATASLRRMLLGDFLTGMLATILATPCSAPFVGVAVGFALTGSITALFGIFIALGIGLAAPWLVIMLVPGLISSLPRPGPWMKWLKRGLALLLVGTALWLASVLFVIAGPIMSGVVLVGIIMIVSGLAGQGRIWARPVATAGAAIVFWLSVHPPAIFNVSQGTTATVEVINDMGSLWRTWQPGMVGPLVDAGQTVFVDVTAAWCITCQANKSLVIEQAPVFPFIRDLVESGKLVLLRADWTRPSDDIAAFLASNERYGIPFNIVYGPNATNGIQLGEILTDVSVLAAINKAMIGK